MIDNAEDLAQKAQDNKAGLYRSQCQCSVLPAHLPSVQ